MAAVFVNRQDHFTHRVLETESRFLWDARKSFSFSQQNQRELVAEGLLFIVLFTFQASI
jgi:hypothetical protein